MSVIETAEKDNRKLEIWFDDDPSMHDPRDWDNLGTMVCWHRRYNLGDKHDFSDPDEYRAWKEPRIELPLFLFDHSGLAMSTSSASFSMADSAGWDWGQVGIVYITKEKIRKEYNRKLITQKLHNLVVEALKLEVKVYDQYLQGEIYGYTVYKDDEELDSCGGFFGSDWKANGMADYLGDNADLLEEI